MAAACALEPTGMSAVLGGDPDEVVAAIERHGLYPANRNGAGQIVAAGALDALAKFAAEPPARTRVIALQVAGAFHTPYMAPAETALGADRRRRHGRRPGPDPAVQPRRRRRRPRPRDAAAPGPPGHRAGPLGPVHADPAATWASPAIIELPPAGTLAGLVKRELKGDGAPEIVTLNTPDDLAAARDLIARHGMTPSLEPAPLFRVVVAANAGTFRPAEGLDEGQDVRVGQVIGHVVTRQGAVEVTAHAAAHSPSGWPTTTTRWPRASRSPGSAGRPEGATR